jgi:LuxR family maltose regulon positive regulatory protein
MTRIPPAKLTPPATSASQVTRSALLDRIVGAAGVRLILIRAAAGFGKTTLMAQLLGRFRQEAIHTGWLTLDASDNDASRFLASLGAAATSIAEPSWGGEEPPNALEQLTRQAEPFALFLDDFESLQSASVLALVRTLLDGLPHGAKLVVGSRSLPELSIARLRARGQVLEIDADALRFSQEEASELFHKQHGTAVSGNVVRQLTERTEGWVTALWLASGSLQETGERPESLVERFSGSTREISDYLAEDVFSRQPEHVREFLLRSSVLRHLEVPLCQALVPRSDAAGILAALETQNLFLVTLPGRTPAWRYHRLFADFLRARLLQERPEEAFRLHLVAAAWYESEGRLVPAIDHAIDAGDYPLALSLLAPHAQRLLEEGRMRLLCRWFDSIPPSVMASHSVLQAVAVWATLFTRGPLQATARLDESDCSSSNDPQVLAHVNALRPLLLSMQDRYDDAVRVGRESLAKLPTSNTFADGALRNAMAQVFTVMGESAHAQQLLDEARDVIGDSLFGRMYAESVEGMLDLQAGRLRMATSRFRTALSATRDASHNYPSGNAWAGVLYASALYETNELQAAQRLVDVYLPMACDVGLPGHMSVGHLISARIAFSRGEIDRSFEALTDLEYLAHHHQLPRIVANAKLERARLLLLRGDAQASKEELDRAEDPNLIERLQRQRLPANEIDYPALARARWAVHFGDARAVVPWLEHELAQAVEQQRHRRGLRLRVLYSLALQRSGDPAAAAKAMATALRQAAQEGFVRMIADEGPQVGHIVQGLHAMLQEMPANRSDPALAQHLDRLLLAFGPLTQAAGSATQATELIEPLTRKEIQVLQLVADGHSNATMAEKLGASDSTVRTHLRSINSKLAAHSRTEAVVIGRRLGVIR